MKETAILKTLPIKRPSKQEREKTVLLGLIDLFLKDGKPVGSNTLQANGFKNLSSATIRNYFAKLEEEGYLTQQHSSGGRMPTCKAYKYYVEMSHPQGEPEKGDEEILRKALKKETKEVLAYLHSAAETLSELTGCPVFLSTPKLEMDFIQSLRLFPLDDARLLCVLVTDFGLIRTETIYTPEHLSLEEAKSIENYFYWRLSKTDKRPSFKDEKTAKWAQRIYNEIMVRHVAGAAQWQPEEIYRTGLSKLLLYPEFSEASSLASGLAIFEDLLQMQAILETCLKKNSLTCWVGDELTAFAPECTECSIIAIPYRINGVTVGAIALLGPARMPYRRLFGVACLCSNYISDALTKSVGKFKIHFKPSQESPQAKTLTDGSLILLEDKRKK